MGLKTISIHSLYYVIASFVAHEKYIRLVVNRCSNGQDTTFASSSLICLLRAAVSLSNFFLSGGLTLSLGVVDDFISLLPAGLCMSGCK